GVGPGDDVDDVAGLVHAAETDAHRLAPDRIVHRARHDAVERGRQPGVALVPPAVAVGVDDDRRPALRSRRVAGLEEQLGVHPADHAARRAARGEPQRLVGVVTEVQVVRGETGVDVLPLARLRVVYGDLAQGAFLRRNLGRGMIGALLAEIRVGR